MLFGLKNLLLVLVVVLVVSCELVSCAKKKFASLKNAKMKTKCNQREFEDLFNKLMIVSAPGQKFPETPKEMNNYCNQTRRLGQKLEHYREHCLKETAKNLVAVIAYSLRSQNRQICRNKNSVRVKGLLEASPCMNQNRNKISKCLEEVAINFGKIQFVSNNRKMPHLCCQYGSFLKCMQTVMDKGKCGEKFPFIVDQFNSVMGNFMDQTCGDFTSETDKCEKLGPIPKANITSSSLLFNMVAVFDSIKDP